MKKALLTTAMCMGVSTAPALAASFDIYAGYYDDYRAPGSPSALPSPWIGDAGVAFYGTPTGLYDTGVLRIVNTGAAAITINDLGLTINYSGDIAPWSYPITIAPSTSAILAQTDFYNLDSSDISPITDPAHPVNDCSVTCPRVTINWSGDGSTVLNVFEDVTHVLDTSGFDMALVGNESQPWKLLGSASAAAVPEPASLAVLAIGLLGLGVVRLRKPQA